MFRSFVSALSVEAMPLWFIAGINTTMASNLAFRFALNAPVFILL
jgi:hypothetical protein